MDLNISFISVSLYYLFWFESCTEWENTERALKTLTAADWAEAAFMPRLGVDKPCVPCGRYPTELSPLHLRIHVNGS